MNLNEFITDKNQLSSLQLPNTELDNVLSRWTGAKIKFNNIQVIESIGKDIRIVIDDNSFAAFFPPNVWRSYDIQVNTTLCLPNEQKSDCFLAKQDYLFFKINLDKQTIEGDAKDYMSADMNISRKKITEYITKTFIDNKKAYPDSTYFSMGHIFDHPHAVRPFRVRLGGKFNPFEYL